LINEVARGDKGTDELHHYILRDADKFPKDSYRLLFIDNHDENSWNGTVASRLGDNAHAAYVLCATLPNAIPLIYSGQEVGLNHSLRFFERDTIDWSLDSQADFYGLMNQLNSTLPALANGASGGTYQAITSNQDRVFAFARKMQDRDVVMVVNFSDKDQDITIQGAPSGNYHDAFTGEGMRLSADESRFFLPAHGYALLVNDGSH
jgi:glycosidase